MRRAKIVATLGPATSSYESVRAIIEAGVDVARMNLSHGELRRARGGLRERAPGRRGRRAVRSPCSSTCRGRRSASASSRTGRTSSRSATSSRSPPRTSLGTKELVGTTFKGLPQDVTPGDFLLIDDGKVKVKVLETDGVRRDAPRSIVAGPVSNNKGINLPGVAVNVPALSEKDEADLRWGLALGADSSRSRSCATPRTSRACTRSWRRRAAQSRSSRRSRSRRRSTTSRRSSTRSTASWSPAVTSASSCRWRRCRSCRSARSSCAAAWPSPSSWRRRCSSR